MRFLLFVTSTVLLSGCCHGPFCASTDYSVGGGQDALTIDLPFAQGYETLCTQGAHGAYSHYGRNTLFDVDLDTPNDADDLVFAPVDGMAYVHDNDRTRNFGVHVNIDVGDGTYIILAHLDDVFIDDGSEVAAGQLIGYEGTTGMSVGDHVHIGRHEGDAMRDGIYGASVEGLIFTALDASNGYEMVSEATDDMICDLSWGHHYASLLETALWHPHGSLVKTPGSSTVYRLENWTARPFMNETAFLSRNYSFADVTLISTDELSCYAAGDPLDGEFVLNAVYDDVDGTGVWLLVSDVTNATRTRIKVPSVGWQAVLKSWGVVASTYDDLLRNSDLSDVLSLYAAQTDLATFRDGALISRTEDSAVYVMSDGVALPIETWDDYLVLGWEDRAIIDVTEEEFDAAVPIVGNCGINSYCVTREDIFTCGGEVESGEGVFSSEVAAGLDFTWMTPDERTASRITLSGEIIHDGVSAGWVDDFVIAENATSVEYAISEMDWGDSFTFSVAYSFDGASWTWSCMSPFPPGTSQGTTFARYNGADMTVITVDDPGSDGCRLQVAIE